MYVRQHTITQLRFKHDYGSYIGLLTMTILLKQSEQNEKLSNAREIKKRILKISWIEKVNIAKLLMSALREKKGNYKEEKEEEEEQFQTVIYRYT